MTNLVSRIERVDDKDGFLKAIRLLAEEIRSRQLVANMCIDEYLESVASWVEDFSECPRNDIDWKSVDYRLILRLLYMGCIYE